MATAVFDRLELPAFPGVPVIDETTSSMSTKILDTNGVPKDKVIRRSDKWEVRFDFSIGGILAYLPVGSFELEVDAEYIGNEVVCGTLTIQAAKGTLSPAGTLDFTNQIVPVAAGVIPKEGVYRITKHLRYTLTPTLKTAAFVESEEVEFY